MNNLEPLCNFEQSKMLKELGFEEETKFSWAYDYDSHCFSEKEEDLYEFIEETTTNQDHEFISCPTISLAKNWLYEKYGIWIETSVFKSGFWCNGWDKTLDLCLGSSNNINPHKAESDCLTEVLKKLTHEKSNS